MSPRILPQGIAFARSVKSVLSRPTSAVGLIWRSFQSLSVRSALRDGSCLYLQVLNISFGIHRLRTIDTTGEDQTTLAQLHSKDTVLRKDHCPYKKHQSDTHTIVWKMIPMAKKATRKFMWLLKYWMRTIAYQRRITWHQKMSLIPHPWMRIRSGTTKHHMVRIQVWTLSASHHAWRGACPSTRLAPFPSIVGTCRVPTSIKHVWKKPTTQPEALPMDIFFLENSFHLGTR